MHVSEVFPFYFFLYSFEQIPGQAAILTGLCLEPGQLWLMGPLIFPCCVFSLAYYILTAPRLRNVDEFILPILQKVVKIYIHDCELQKDLMCWIFETKTYEPDKTPFISLRGSNGLEACLFFCLLSEH